MYSYYSNKREDGRPQPIRRTIKESLPNCGEIEELSTELESQAYDPLGIRKIYPTLIVQNVVQNGNNYPKLTPVHINGS
jgi:hypothetical protein